MGIFNKTIIAFVVLGCRDDYSQVNAMCLIALHPLSHIEHTCKIIVEFNM